MSCRFPKDIRKQFEMDGQPYAVFIDNNLGSKPEYLRRLCKAPAPLERIWSAAITLDVTDDPSLVREMALAGCTGVFHRDWEKYDTAHVVFRPARMTVQELELGYDWLYRRLFSLSSIWARRPRQTAAVLPYLAMSLLYKRSNRLWKFLIRHRLVHTVWRPLVELTRLRHVRFRKRLARQRSAPLSQFGSPVAAGV